MAIDEAEITRLEVELGEIRDALSAVRKYGQAHGINGRSLSRADLKALREDEARIERKLARARRGGGIPAWQAVPRG